MAVPAAAPAVEVGGGLAAVLAAVGSFTLWLLWRFTIGFVILRLADIFARVSIPTGIFGSVKPFDFAARALRTIDRNVNNALWQSMLASEHFAVWLFLEAAHQTAATAGAINNGLASTGEALHRLEQQYLPWLWKTNSKPLTQSIGTIKTQTKDLHNRVTDTAKQTKTTAKVLHNTIAVTLPRVDAGSKTRDKALSKRLTKVEKLLTAAGAAALVVAGIAKLGLKWIRCPKVGKVGKSVCNMDSNLLDSLLADALVIASTISIVELGKACSGFIEDTESALTLFVRELK